MPASNLKDIHQTILGLLTLSATPVSAYDVLGSINRDRKDKLYAPPQVYRALKSLTEKKLIHRLETKNAYVVCKHETHVHKSHTCTHDKAVQFLVCSNCGVTAEIEMPSVLKTMNRAAEDAGFTITQPVIELVGICARCK